MIVELILSRPVGDATVLSFIFRRRLGSVTKTSNTGCLHHFVDKLLLPEVPFLGYFQHWIPIPHHAFHHPMHGARFTHERTEENDRVRFFRSMHHLHAV